MTIVHTIGHSTRDFDLVVTMLRSNMVTQLLDVRSFPSSRKFPQWDREYVESSLPPNIGYQWMPQLGGRRYTPVGVPTPNGGWRVKAFRDYADYITRPLGEVEPGSTHGIHADFHVNVEDVLKSL